MQHSVNLKATLELDNVFLNLAWEKALNLLGKWIDYIRIREEWLWNSTNFFVVELCSFFWPCPCTKDNSCLLCTKEITNRNFSVTESCILHESKTHCAESWTFQHKFCHLCFFDVSLASWPSINYDWMNEWKCYLNSNRRAVLLNQVFTSKRFFSEL